MGITTHQGFTFSLISSPPVTGNQSALPQEDAATEPVTTLRWFIRWNDERVANIAGPLLTRFHAEHPTIRVVVENAARGSDYYDQLRLQLSQGKAPDIFYPATHVAHELTQQGALLPLNEFLRADDIDLSAYDPRVLDLYRSPDQQLYCLPIDIATLAVAYNRTLFDEAGIPYPQAPWHWEDLLTTAKAFTKDTDGDGMTDQYGIDRFHTYWPLLVWSATGHNVFDDPKQPTEFLLEEEDSVNAIQWLADLDLVHGVMPPATGIDGVPDLFLAGKAAMQIAGHWRVPAYLATPDLDVDFVALPADTYQANRIDGSCFAIAQATAHPQAAWTFIKFLAGPDATGAKLLTELQQITPALTTLQASSAFHQPPVLPDQNLAAFLPPPLNSAATATRSVESRLFPLYDPLHPIFTEWEPVMSTELDAVWAGERSADEAVGRMANQAENLLESLPTSAATVDSTMPPPPANEPNATDMAAEGITTRAIPTATVPLTPLGTLSMTIPVIGGDSFSTDLSDTPRHLYVAPNGNDRYSGLFAAFPLATIQKALDIVSPGDTIHLAPGDYFENITSQVAGRPAAPITIMGPADAILRGNGDASAGFYLTHSYYTLTGFTIDGLHGDPTTKDGYTQKLLYVQGTGVKQGVTGLRVLNMTFRNAGGECLRLRYFAHHNEVAYSTFHVCGLLDFAFDEGGKNGEAIYIGTAPDQWADGKNPTADPDQSSNNWIHHNSMDTQGNECAEIKEGGYGNVVEYNLCTGQLDPDSAGIGARGNDNVIRYNTIYNNVGAGIRLGGHDVGGIQYGIDNDVYGNYLSANQAGGVKIIVEPQRQICSNQLERNLGKEVFGDGSDTYVPTSPC
ncbi:MAG: extracellular solute-binding protein [Caldilineaceae bacterium]